MSLKHSSSIVTDNLILYYDMYNKKSFMGAPATNQITSVSWSGDGVNQSAIVKGSTLVTDENFKFRGLETYLWAPGVSVNCYIGNQGGTGNVSTEWTFSCFIRCEDRSVISSLGVYMYYPSSDGSAPGTIIDMGDGWYFVYRTRTGTSNYLSLTGFTGFSTNKKYYLSGVMLSKTSYPVYPTATNGTRSATQSILDLSGTTTLTASSLTYSGISSFSFDGNADYIDCGTGGALTLGNNGSFTVGAWINCTSLKNFSAILSKVIPDRSGSYNFMCTMHNNGTLAFYNNAAWYYSTNQGLTTNTWYYVNFVFDGNATMSYYVNGTSAGTSSLTWPETTTYKVFIGSWYSVNTSYDFNGTIAIAQLYNRALSSAEVLQNFNSLRGRFGI